MTNTNTIKNKYRVNNITFISQKEANNFAIKNNLWTYENIDENNNKIKEIPISFDLKTGLETANYILFYNGKMIEIPLSRNNLNTILKDNFISGKETYLKEFPNKRFFIYETKLGRIQPKKRTIKISKNRTKINDYFNICKSLNLNLNEVFYNLREDGHIS